ncbi:MAG: hypothetical protein ACKOCM_12045 [Cyanobacteriota bacterium]
MLIYVCNSAHGFGHGSRTAAVLTELAIRRPNWRLVLSTALPEAFLRLAYGTLPIEHRCCRWDVGVIQADALGCDPEATLVALNTLRGALPALVEREALWLEQQMEPVLVLADVPPAAARLAERIRAPLVWLASFGWEAIYRPMGEAFQVWAEEAETLYRRGDRLISCPLAMPINWSVPRQNVGLTAGRPRHTLADLRRRLELPTERERCVLISFGGLGLAVPQELFRRWPNHVFIEPEPALEGVTNGRRLPHDLRPLDLMPLCGRLITKPGYSSFCEAMSQGLAIHAVHRDGFAEAAVLELALQHHGHQRLLSQGQLRQGDWELDQDPIPPLEGPLATDGAQAAAALLEGWVSDWFPGAL